MNSTTNKKQAEQVPRVTSRIADSSTITRKIGANRGKTRLWIEGKALSNYGWVKGVNFKAVWDEGVLRYLPVMHPACWGAAIPSRKVAGTLERPIIDTNTNKLRECLGVEAGDSVEILISHVAIEVRKC